MYCSARVILLFIWVCIASCSSVITTSSEPLPSAPVQNTTSEIDELDSNLQHPAVDVTDTLATISLDDTALSKNTAPVDNLWVYLANNVSTLDYSHPKVQARIKWYSQHPQYMKRITERAKPFLYYIVEQLEQRNMPLEIALLPIVESSFDPFAISHGNARGMWQFMPATAKRFGMKWNYWYDGRRDIVASTQGALDYLEYLHRFFNGNWEHALAAYNSGEGRVRSAIRKNKRLGKPTDYWSLPLPKETQGYLPKLMAITAMLKSKEDYPLTWPKIPNEPVIEVVDIDSQIDLALVAQLSGLTLKEVQALNPGFNRWATDPDGPHRLILPKIKRDAFLTALSSVPNNERVKWARHKIQSGESLGLIAQQYETSVTFIKRINQLDSNVIFAGQHILIPRSQAALEDYPLSQSQLNASRNQYNKQRVQIKHTIKPGDSLWKLARIYNTNVKQLARWNKMGTNTPLQIGKELSVWLNKDKPVGVSRTITYTVKPGDSLSRIGSKYNVDISDIRKWNKLENQKYLKPGQRLKIIVDVTRASS